MSIQIDGDLLLATEDAIVQQCNCVTNKPHGLSSAIFKKWPEADCYTVRQNGERDTPGGLVVKECNDGKIVINLLGQYYPSKSKYKNDSPEKRYTVSSSLLLIPCEKCSRIFSGFNKD